MVSLGDAFVVSARKHFRGLFVTFGFVEIDSHVNLNGGVLVAKNDGYYLTVSCDLRDRWVSAGVGRLSEDLVPPPPIGPPRSAEDVREIPSSVVAWLATGNKDDAFALGSYDDENPVAVDEAVERVAGAMSRYGSRLLGGDKNEWRRAAELTVSRTWHPG
jgi:hypothetical protein